MAKLELDAMNGVQFDVLKEIGNIGAGNATTALATMLHIKVDMKVPKVALLDFQELPEILGGAENIIAGILLTLSGSIDGMMMFVLERDAAHSMENMLMGQDVPLDAEFSEMEASALQEIGNIITGAYLASLSNLTDSGNSYSSGPCPFLENEFNAFPLPSCMLICSNPPTI